jgi:ParB family chromosome partitioning protein
MPEEVAAKLEVVSDEIDAISAKRYAYDANVIAHGGAFVVLHHDGTVRIERGFVRAEDEALADPKPEAEADATDRQVVEDEQDEDVQEIEEEDEDRASRFPTASPATCPRIGRWRFAWRWPSNPIWR